MANLNPLRFCSSCKTAKLRATFRSMPGTGPRREMCAECFEKTPLGAASAWENARRGSGRKAASKPTKPTKPTKLDQVL